MGRLRSNRRLTCPPLPRQETTLGFHAMRLSKVSADEQTLGDVPRNDGPKLRVSDTCRRELRKPGKCASCDIGLERRGAGPNLPSLDGGVAADLVGPEAAAWVIVFDPFVNKRHHERGSYGRAREDWTLRRQPVPATRRLGHHSWTGNCTQVMSSHFPDKKHELQLKDRRELAAHASHHSLSSREHIFLDVCHCNVEAVGALRETSV